MRPTVNFWDWYYDKFQAVLKDNEISDLFSNLSITTIKITSRRMSSGSFVVDDNIMYFSSGITETKLKFFIRKYAESKK